MLALILSSTLPPPPPSPLVPQSFTGFTVICFGVEVAVLFAAFRRKFFNHMGYVLDLVVVALCLHHELAGMGKGGWGVDKYLLEYLVTNSRDLT